MYSGITIGWRLDLSSSHLCLYDSAVVKKFILVFNSYNLSLENSKVFGRQRHDQWILS